MLYVLQVPGPILKILADYIRYLGRFLCSVAAADLQMIPPTDAHKPPSYKLRLPNSCDVLSHANLKVKGTPVTVDCSLHNVTISGARQTAPCHRCCCMSSWFLGLTLL